MAMPWNSGSAFQFSVPPMMPRNSRRRTTGKIRTRWLGKNRFNPIRFRKPNNPDIKVTERDTIDIDIKAPLPIKACDRFGLSCSFCKQGSLHPLPQESDWSSEDWDGTKPKRKEKSKETNLLSDWDLPKPQPNIGQKTDVDGMDLSKLHIG